MVEIGRKKYNKFHTEDRDRTCFVVVVVYTLLFPNE